MAKVNFSIKRNDTLPPIEGYIKDSAGAAVDLTGAAVEFHLRKTGAANAKVVAPATIVDASAGHVRYNWTANDTNEDGLYEAEWQITDAAGRIVTAPNKQNIIVQIVKDLA